MTCIAIFIARITITWVGPLDMSWFDLKAYFFLFEKYLESVVFFGKASYLCAKKFIYRMGRQPKSFKYKLSQKALPFRRGKKSMVDYVMFRQDSYWYVVIAYKDAFVEYHRLMDLRMLEKGDFYKMVRFYKETKSKNDWKYLSSGTMSVGQPGDCLHVCADFLIIKNDIYYCLKRDWDRKPGETTKLSTIRFKKLTKDTRSIPIFIKKTVTDWDTYWAGQKKLAKANMEAFAEMESKKRCKILIPAKGTKGFRMYLQLYPVISKAFISLRVEGAVDSCDGSHLFADYAQRLVAKGEADPLMKKRPKRPATTVQP